MKPMRSRPTQGKLGSRVTRELGSASRGRRDIIFQKPHMLLSVVSPGGFHGPVLAADDKIFRGPGRRLGLSMYRCPRFSKVCFYERTTLGPVFTNRKKSKEEFHFCEKRQTDRTAFIVRQGALTEAVVPEQQSGPAELRPWELQSASRHQAARASTASVSISALSRFTLCLPQRDAS